MSETKLSLDLLPGDEVLLSGPARMSIIKKGGRRVRVEIKADKSVTVTRIENK